MLAVIAIIGRAIYLLIIVFLQPDLAARRPFRQNPNNVWATALDKRPLPSKNLNLEGAFLCR
jgi:hypothetical protein